MLNKVYIFHILQGQDNLELRPTPFHFVDNIQRFLFLKTGTKSGGNFVLSVETRKFVDFVASLIEIPDHKN
jgi:hypothetical protein